MTLAPSGAEVLTVEFKISLLAPGRTGCASSLPHRSCELAKGFRFARARCAPSVNRTKSSSLLCCRPSSPNRLTRRSSELRPGPMRNFRVVTSSSLQPRALPGAVADLVSLDEAASLFNGTS
jgi:hypothetical protein